MGKGGRLGGAVPRPNGVVKSPREMAVEVNAVLFPVDTSRCMC